VVHADFRDVSPEALAPESRAVCCFFYPFVSEDPCQGWGLPARFARYEELLSHARKMMEGAASAALVACHQGEWEAERARQIYARSGWEVVSEGVLQVSEIEAIWPSRHDVHVFSCLARASMAG
jgi:hypothetical protein